MRAGGHPARPIPGDLPGSGMQRRLRAAWVWPSRDTELSLPPCSPRNAGFPGFPAAEAGARLQSAEGAGRRLPDRLNGGPFRHTCVAPSGAPSSPPRGRGHGLF